MKGLVDGKELRFYLDAYPRDHSVNRLARTVRRWQILAWLGLAFAVALVMFGVRF
jgi:hypothetical protein